MKQKFPALTAKARKREADMESLCSWFDDILEKVRAEYVEIVNDAGQYKLRGFGTRIDVTQFSRDDLKPLLGRVEALHDFCRDKDISLDIAGFDLLPHAFTVAKYSSRWPTGVIVEVDASHTYCGYAHPHASPGKDLHYSAPRLPLAAPVEAKDVGTSREFTVHTPIRLRHKQKPQPAR